MPTISRQIEIPSELYQKLEDLAKRQNRSVLETVLEAVTEYLDLEFDENERNESIRDGFLEGWHEAMKDVPSRPIWDILQELDNDE